MTRHAISEPVNLKYSAPAAACAAQILNHLADVDGPKTAADIARGIKHSKSLVFRVLQELQRFGFVDRPSNGTLYGLGYATLEIGTAFLARTDLMQSAQSVLRELSHETGETTNLGVLRGAEVLYLIKHEGRNSVVTISHVGARIPATCTALGKAILALLNQEELAALVPPVLPQLTPKSLKTLEELVADLDAARARGYAFDDGEAVLGRYCIAAPLSLPSPGIDRAAISLSMSSEAFADRGGEVLEALLEVAARLNREGEARVSMGDEASANLKSGSA